MSPQTSYIFTVSKLTSLKILGGRQHRATPAGQILGVATRARLTPMALRCRTSWCLVLSLLLRTREAGLYWKVDLLDCVTVHHESIPVSSTETPHRPNRYLAPVVILPRFPLCLSVNMRLSARISQKTTRHKISMHVTCGPVVVYCWQRCNAIWTSRFLWMT